MYINALYGSLIDNESMSLCFSSLLAIKKSTPNQQNIHHLLKQFDKKNINLLKKFKTNTHSEHILKNILKIVIYM